MNLEVNLGGLVMKNPVTVGSGTFGSGREYGVLGREENDALNATLPIVPPEHSAQQASLLPEDATQFVSELAFYADRRARKLAAPSTVHRTVECSVQIAHPNAPEGQSAPRNRASFSSLTSLGALTTKGVSLVPWEGNPTPRIAETACGMLNSIGLQNKGVEAFCADDLVWLAENAAGLPVIVNVCGHRVEEFAPVIERLEDERVVSAYEINISCPNLDCGGMSLGVDPEVAAKVTRACRQVTKRPLIVKLTPNVTDITLIANCVEAAGADAISLINTVAGMAIDASTRKPLLARGSGGLSGPAIKPVALLAVHKCYQAVNLPLLGMGGIRNATDAIEFILAGATAIAVGSASFTDPLTAFNLSQEIEEWCLSHDVSDINDLIGGLIS